MGIGRKPNIAVTGGVSNAPLSRTGPNHASENHLYGGTVVLHWDGPVLASRPAGTQHVDRVPIAPISILH